MALFQKYNGRPEDNEILSRMEDCYSRSVSENQDYWAEASIDSRFESGDQTIWGELYSAPVNRRQLFGFNRIRRIVNSIDGHQRQNRKSIVATPIENGDDVTAGQFTKIIMWVNQQEQVLETVSDAFNGALISGMNMLQTWVDYRRDPINGDIRVDNCSYNSFLIDPFFKKADLSDCNFVWKRSFLTPREVAALLPDHSEEIMMLPANGTISDGRFGFMPETRNILAKDLLAYDEYYYRDYRKQRILVDTQTGESMEWRSPDEDGLQQFLQLYPQVLVTEQDIPTVSLAIVVQGRVMYNAGNPLNIDVYPFVPVFGYFKPELPCMAQRVQSVVRGLRDAQYLYNRRRLIELDMLESAVTTGLIFKENALVDPKEAFMTGQGRAIALKETAQMTDVQQITPPQIPPSMMQLSEVLANEMQQISGINEAALGIGENNKSGYDTMLKMNASLVTLQGLFDSLDRSQKLLGKIMVSIIQSNFTPGKVKRIIEEEPTEEFYNKNFGKYDVVIEDGFNTSTQRQMQFAQLINLREIGVPVPDTVLIEACTLENKKALIDTIEKANQAQQQLQEQQAQVAMQELSSRAELSAARAMADRGLGVERASRVVENQSLAVEREAQAEQDRSQAALNMIKAAKELEGIDLTHLERLINLARAVKEQEAQEAVIKTQQNMQPTSPTVGIQ